MLRKATMAIAAGSATLLLAGCGSDATVDNSESSTVASVTPSSSKSDAATKDKDKESEANATAAPAPAPQDGGVDQVEEVPSAPERSAEDEEFLAVLKDKGIDLGSVEGAGNAGGLEDQVIAAGKSQCGAQREGSPEVFLPVAAGQLTTQGVTDKDPEQVEKILRDAVNSSYCK
ncbi:MAG TPA: DUF732 domain-containing protein [Candidatus Corynebacterium gallistercoris]|uniref:DUF732 domain-containing protein n=1 Tax=Candidatus Corynebacterium gallistercoris TaxID=2838530 RepID=A0A9D1RY26_9CORY|nr:DUF732 domain-containing protein [Candidatus Corynebacterium gallistercoris]